MAAKFINSLYFLIALILHLPNPLFDAKCAGITKSRSPRLSQMFFNLSSETLISVLAQSRL